MSQLLIFKIAGEGNDNKFAFSSFFIFEKVPLKEDRNPTTDACLAQVLQ